MHLTKVILLILSVIPIGQLMGQFEDYKSYESFEKGVLNQLEEDKTYVINFWATWCRPCVQELPYFDALSKDEEANVNVILVSLDFDHQIESKFKPFLKKRDLHPKVVLLRDGDYNAWINKVSPLWSGAIPATLYIRNGKKLFKEKQYHSKEEIIQELEQLNH